jgi:hypothetical protein
MTVVAGWLQLPSTCGMAGTKPRPEGTGDGASQPASGALGGTPVGGRPNKRE